MGALADIATGGEDRGPRHGAGPWGPVRRGDVHHLAGRRSGGGLPEVSGASGARRRGGRRGQRDAIPPAPGAPGERGAVAGARRSGGGDRAQQRNPAGHVLVGLVRQRSATSASRASWRARRTRSVSAPTPSSSSSARRRGPAASSTTGATGCSSSWESRARCIPPCAPLVTSGRRAPGRCGWAPGRRSTPASRPWRSTAFARGAFRRPIRRPSSRTDGAAEGDEDRWHDALAIALDQDLRLIAVDAIEVSPEPWRVPRAGPSACGCSPPQHGCETRPATGAGIQFEQQRARWPMQQRLPGEQRCRPCQANKSMAAPP